MKLHPESEEWIQAGQDTPQTLQHTQNTDGRGYDCSASDIRCNADAVGATIYEIVAPSGKTVRVRAHDRTSAIEAATEYDQQS